MGLKTLIIRQLLRHPRLRRGLTALLERNRDSDVTITDATVQINHRREHGYLRASRLIQKNGTLRDELPVLMNLFALIRDGDTFVDVGANVGLYTQNIARLTQLHPDLHIVAIEAHPDTFKRLIAHPHKRITFHNFAAGNIDGEATFVDGAVSHVFTTQDQSNAYNINTERFRVRTVRLDALDYPTERLILKIDVEGQERAVLDGAIGLFKAGRVKAVYLDGFRDESIINLLKGWGFVIHEGRTLQTTDCPTFSLLAFRPDLLH